MMNFAESGAGRLAARIQAIAAGFDPEVLSLPGGSVIAAFLWLYAGAALRLRRGAARQASMGAPAAGVPALGVSALGISGAPAVGAPAVRTPAVRASLVAPPMPVAACAGCLGRH